ncbi:hypothetical protein LEMLEM_LOCUS22376 [Lemmus lemmus]
MVGESGSWSGTLRDHIFNGSQSGKKACGNEARLQTLKVAPPDLLPASCVSPQPPQTVRQAGEQVFNTRAHVGHHSGHTIAYIYLNKLKEL